MRLLLMFFLEATSRRSCRASISNHFSSTAVSFCQKAPPRPPQKSNCCGVTMVPLKRVGCGSTQELRYIYIYIYIYLYIYTLSLLFLSFYYYHYHVYIYISIYYDSIGIDDLYDIVMIAQIYSDIIYSLV